MGVILIERGSTTLSSAGCHVGMFCVVVVTLLKVPMAKFVINGGGT